jgi:3-methyladenine DNA glycosylase AlkD
MTYTDVAKAIKKQADPVRAEHSQGFFRTGKGQYGEGDVFLGLTVPKQRTIAKQFRDLPLSDVQTLLTDKYHEHRLTALIILVSQYERGDEKKKKTIVDMYLANLKWVNNWDLVDVTAPKILGRWLLARDKKMLYKLAKSKDLWEKRVSIVTTWMFIREGKLKDTFKLSEILLHDKHDLIHKAVGWMLREAGKKDIVQLEAFLAKHYKSMPRTMLRYSIEKFPEVRRKMYLKGLI